MEGWEVPREGLSGGLLLGWMSTHKLHIQYNSKHLIHADLIDNRGNPLSISFMYGHPILSKRERVWSDLKNIRNIAYRNWLCIGDFNQILTQNDKFGFKTRKIEGTELLKQTLFDLELCELEAKGQKFTWMNGHEDDTFVMERLDRAYATMDWFNAYPHYVLLNPAIIRSDHRSILLDFDLRQTFRKRPLGLRGCGSLTLNEYQVLPDIVRQSRAKNRLTMLEKVNGNQIEDLNEIEAYLVDHFKNQYSDTGSKEVHTLLGELRGLPIPKLDHHQRYHLDRQVTNVEIEEAVFQLGPHKAPGLDGIPAFFYQEFWSFVKQDIFNYVHAFFHSGSMLRSLNHTYITLIPKTLPIEEVNQFRPISLYNVTYKIISKS
ncbi:uncharacterized protein LOC142632825 [Castanea sativa]|uniref:uncharacterized protein LOC142632825 n=1 Tax=Castanea sativa TaxID=21020 RepID=UPI003F64B88D